MKLVKATYQNVLILAIVIHSENIKIISNRINQKHGHLTKRERLIIYSFTQLEERPRVSDHNLLLRMSCAHICNHGEHTQGEL